MKFQEIALRLSHLLCSPITGNTRYLSRSSVMYDHYQEMFEKMLKECRVFGLKKKREGRTGRKNTFQNEDFSGDSRNQAFPMPTENRARKKITFIF